jgi:20S proteasome alpha/beta subunit
MTFILGAHCSDGVVLVADRKVTIDDGAVDYQNKLFKHHLSPIVYGSSGSTFLFQRFKEQSFIAAQKYKGAIDWFHYRDDLEDITKRLNKRHRKQEYEFEVIAAARAKSVDEPIVMLYHIHLNGSAWPVRKYPVIGSGEPYGSIFLSKCWRKEMLMQDVAEIGYFIIRNIDENELDKKVGLDKRDPDKIHPQIYYIPNNVELEIREANEQELNAIKEKVDVWLTKYENQIKNLFR